MSDDLISRQAVVDAIEGWWNNKTQDNDIYNIIKDLPSVTLQEPKIARWTVGHDEQGEIIACGNCGRVFPTMEPYCGNCGRRMLKPVKEEKA